MVKGVNLGNWLVLEKWMSPDLFEGTTAEDETDLCHQLGPEKAGAVPYPPQRLHHRTRLRLPGQPRRRRGADPGAVLRIR